MSTQQSAEPAEPGRHRAEPWRNAETGYSCKACREGRHELCDEHVQWGPTDGGTCDCYASNGNRHAELRALIVTQKLALALHDYTAFQYGECDHGTYSGGTSHGEPYEMCKLAAASGRLEPVVAALVKGEFYR